MAARLPLLTALLAVAALSLMTAAGAQQTGLTESDCKAYHYRELPEVRSDSKLQCNSQHRDWSNVAVIAHEPSAASLNRDLPSSFLKKVEVIAHKKFEVDEPKDLIESLAGPNHYLVFSHVGRGNDTSISVLPALTVSEIFNRMVMMTNADIVIMAYREGIAQVNEAMIQGAAQIFKAHPNMGILGTYMGYTMGGWIGATPKLVYVAAVETGPIIIRRSAFLEVGMLDCLSEKCFQEAVHSLSLRMLLAGRRIGLMSFPNKDGIVVDRPEKNIPHPKPECDQTGVESLLQRAVLKYSRLFTPREYIAKTDLSIDGISGSAVPTENMTYCEPEKTCGSHIQTGILLQYFNRPEQISPVLASVYRSLHRDGRTNMTRVEIIVHDDSRSDYTLLRRRLGLYPRSFLIYAPNTHEIRGYNRMAKFSNARNLVFAQDDDAPLTSGAVGWHQQFLDLFRDHPNLGFLGAHRGRMDFGWMVDGRTNQISGPKFGAPSDTGRSVAYRSLNYYSPTTGIPFMYMYKINAGPLMVNRHRFLRAGMFYSELSCPGEPGIGFDFEYSIRTWSLGQQVGLFAANWTGHIGDSTTDGTRANEEKWRMRRTMELRNNGLMYEMYPTYHHTVGNKLATDSLKTLLAGPGSFRVHEDENLRATLAFLKSMQFSMYCDLLGYSTIVKEALGVCCKELIVPEPIGTRAKHEPEDYQCVQEPKMWSSMAEAARAHLELNEMWLEEEAGWTNLHRYFDGTVLNEQPEWQEYLGSAMEEKHRVLAQFEERERLEAEAAARARMQEAEERAGMEAHSWAAAASEGTASVEQQGPFWEPAPEAATATQQVPAPQQPLTPAAAAVAAKAPTKVISRRPNGDVVELFKWYTKDGRKKKVLRKKKMVKKSAVKGQPQYKPRGAFLRGFDCGGDVGCLAEYRRLVNDGTL